MSAEIPILRSIGPPPERYADRVVASMLRSIAYDRAQRWQAVSDIFTDHSNRYDGNPLAQARMAEKMRKAGAVLVKLTNPGKRGKYTMDIYDWSGWNAEVPPHGAEIGVKDPIPEKPQIVCWLNTIKGLGHHRYANKNTPILFIGHHALSRFAQRLYEGHEGVEVTITADRLLVGVSDLWNAAIGLIAEKGGKGALDVPPWGWRIPFDGGVAVFNKHDQRKSLIVSTILPKGAPLLPP
jgi:hypothetical protein